METENESIRERWTAPSLPTPPYARVLTVGAICAVAGAAVWGLLRIYAHIEVAYLATGIGALIGFGIVKAGGHGTPLAVASGVLALISIVAGKHIAYQADYADVLQGLDAKILQSDYEEMKVDARDWAALGDTTDDEAVETFALSHEFDVEDAAEFRTEFADGLQAFQAANPSFEEWSDGQRAIYRELLAADYSFVDYLKEDFHPFDLLFVVLGIAAAFGLVQNATNDLKTNAMRQRRAAAEQQREASPSTGEAIERKDDDSTATG